MLGPMQAKIDPEARGISWDEWKAQRAKPIMAAAKRIKRAPQPQPIIEKTKKKVYGLGLFS